MNTENQPDKLDRILAEEDALLPSSGFAASVMDAINQEALAPAPIPFPWKRFAPGLAALVIALVVLGRYAILATRSIDLSLAPHTDWLAWYRSSAQTAIVLRTAGAPALLALVLSFGCVVLCLRFAVGRAAS